ncbi:hypothetical protein AN416_02545 [Paraburkholderia caribensis]|nr:hypothetical protein AN416_02545 [Paraburkholderia caribensis]AUT53194.1 hypothetical protein C2L66_15935 [Paraburkholderia caribensis]
MNWLSIGATLGLLVATQNATAQSFPPACQQYVTTIKICGADLVRLAELKQPAQADEVRANYKTAVTRINSALEKAIEEQGATAVAQRCATAPGNEVLRKQVADIVTVLGFGGGISDQCSTAYSAIR